MTYRSIYLNEFERAMLDVAAQIRAARLPDYEHDAEDAVAIAFQLLEEVQKQSGRPVPEFEPEQEKPFELLNIEELKQRCSKPPFKIFFWARYNATWSPAEVFDNGKEEGFTVYAMGWPSPLRLEQLEAIGPILNSPTEAQTLKRTGGENQ